MISPYYQDESVTLYCADCMEVLPHLPKVDLLLTDPPYGEVSRNSNGLRSLDKLEADILDIDINKVLQIIEFSGSAYVFCGTGQVSGIKEFFVDRGLSTRQCVWVKTNPSPMNGGRIWLSAIENCVFAKKSGAVFNENCKPCVWKFPSGSSNMHPTQKPTDLFNYLINVSSLIGDTILDPFAGSGTTGVAAKALGRKAILIEREEKYCEIIVKRLAQEYLPL